MLIIIFFTCGWATLACSQYVYIYGVDYILGSSTNHLSFHLTVELLICLVGFTHKSFSKNQLIQSLFVCRDFSILIACLFNYQHLLFVCLITHTANVLGIFRLKCYKRRKCLTFTFDCIFINLINLIWIIKKHSSKLTTESHLTDILQWQ